MKERMIECEKCHAKFQLSADDFKQKSIKLNGIKFDLVYFKCPKCGEAYLTTLLDYKGKQLQDNYIKAIDAYTKALKKGTSEAILRSKYEKIDTLKAQALSYEQELINKYGHMIPDNVLEK